MKTLDQLSLSPAARSRLGSLDAADRKTLNTLIADAQRHQEEELQRATEAALKHLPLLLRGPVRKILGL